MNLSHIPGCIGGGTAVRLDIGGGTDSIGGSADKLACTPGLTTAMGAFGKNPVFNVPAFTGFGKEILPGFVPVGLGIFCFVSKGKLKFIRGYY